MSPEQLGAMTLADAEALAARLESAARTIRDAMSLMGGGVPQTMESIARGPMLTMGVNRGPPSAIEWTPAELAERERLRAQRLAADEAAVLEAQ